MDNSSRETFAVRRLVASTFGPRQAQDTKTAYAIHEKTRMLETSVTPLFAIHLRIMERLKHFRQGQAMETRHLAASA